MKDLVLSLTKEQLTWVFLGLGISGGLIDFAVRKKGGEALTIFVGGLVLAFVSYLPEEVFNKATDLFKWMLDKIRI